jgi:signal transduction histidine kinase
MKLSLKVRLTAFISLLVLLVVLGVSGLYLLHFVRRELQNVQLTAGYIRQEIYSRAREAVASAEIPAYINRKDPNEVRAFLQVRLSQDKGLMSLMQSAVGYYPSIDYVALTGPNRIILADYDSSQVGKQMPPVPSLSDLLHAGLIQELESIYGPPQDYEVQQPLQLDFGHLGKVPLNMRHQWFGDVCVGVSSVFLSAEVTPRLKSAVELAGVTVVLATLIAGLLSFTALRPLATISQSVELMARGEFTQPVRLKREDEWGILSSRLNLLGEQMRGDKAAFLALKENTDQLIANLSDGLMLFDGEDRLVLATPATRRFLQRPVEELVHKNVADVFGGSSPLERLLREVLAQRQTLRSHPVDLPGNPEIPRAAVTTHIVRERDDPMWTLVTLRDAETRAQLEDQIGVTTRLAALGRLTSGVAHEVKNPLNAMIIQVEILRSKLANDGASVNPHLDVLSEEIRRLDRVVKTFLDFTKPLEINRTETNLADLVREVFTLAEPHAQANGVQLVLELNGSVPIVQLDRDLIKQALLNLVINGCQAMPHGGELRVTPHVGVKHLDLEIADQGVGIPEDARQKIFALYYTTKAEGTGVGLATVYRIIQLHDGSIDFTSELNRGTTFRVSLPS